MAKRRPDEPMIGQTLAHYRIDAKIGEGGMGVVYRATDTHLDRSVAIKVLGAEAVASDDRKRRFALEARAASALNHSNIVTIHDITSANGVDFIVMEFVTGQTLGGLIGRRGLPITEALHVAVQIADALGRAHAGGIVHRDLKPANIMVSEDGRVKVLDFGLAKLTESEPVETTLTMHVDQTPRTEAGTILGTVAYMSPEQAEGKKVDSRSDIFSFGSVLYEMLTGRRAFHGETKISTLAAILREEPKPFSEVMPGAPREIERIVTSCLRKDPRRRFQHMEDIRILLDSLREDGQSRQLSEVLAAPAPPERRIPFAMLAAVLVTATVAGGLTWWLTRASALKTGLGPVFRQVTFDSGLTTDPALSPDGKLLAYASDRAGESNLDIWVQQVAGGEPVRVTHASEDDHEPDFSSDGSKIAFRSEREPPGVYLVSTLGGDERLIALGGRHPRFSPDGKWIVYAGAHEQAPKIYIVAAIGGAARELQTGTPFATFPIWSPDGRHLLFIGRSELSPFSRLDWWVTPIEGGRAVSTGAAGALDALGLRSDLSSGPRAWSSEGVLFSAVLGGSMNLWRVPIASKSWRVEGAPARLTAGSGKESQASAAGKTLVFTSLNESVKLWSLPINSKQGQVSGPPRRVTFGTTEDGRPSISADGRMLAYLSNRSGNMDVWLRDMTTGKEVAVTATPGNELHPRLTRDGAKLCYEATEHGRQVIYVASTGLRPGLPEKICDDCGLPMDWSADGNSLVYWRPNPTRWFTIDVNTRESSELIPGVENDIHNVQYSPDGRWISFDLFVERAVFVTALKGRTAGGRSEWIRVSEGGHAWWSPDGNLLYFLSSRDGFQCLWAQRLELKTRQPVGENFAVQHFHGARRAPNGASLGWGLASDRFILPITETMGNVWLATFE